MVRIIRPVVFLVFAMVLAQLTSAQTVTQAGLSIGGQSSLSSEGYDRPGRLDDGLTRASAVYTFTLDTVASTLVVRVDNTSIVVPGAANPVLTDVFFNSPAAVTDMSLVSQVQDSAWHRHS